MASAVLPDLLRNKLDQLAVRLHRLRLLRGVSWVVLTLVGGAALSVVLDYWLELPPVVRTILFAGSIVGTGLMLWWGLLQPLRRPLTAAALAAAVEDEFPRLKERLTSSVELAESNDEYHGSRAFVRLLVRETDLKTRALDFCRAAPSQKSEWSVAGAIAALLLIAAPTVLWPDTTFGLGRRFLMPWDRRPAYLPFTFAVTPGDGYAAKGRPLMLSIELTPKQSGVTLPTSCTLTLAPADGKPLRLRMSPGDKTNTFAFRLDEVKSDFRYYFEIGSGETDAYSLRAIDPVDLAAGYPIATLMPPAYANVLPPQKTEGLSDLNVLQFGRVALQCRFTRPAGAAALVWTRSGNDAKSERIPLQLAEDRRSAHVEMMARDSGTLQLELDAGHGILTSPLAQALVVTVDQPPEFRRLTGLPEQAEAKPTDTLSLTLAIADDLGVAAVEVEYRVNDGLVQREPVSLAGTGTPSVSGAFAFKLSDKAKDGDIVRLRVRAADTRNVPEANVGPNVAYFPSGDRWAELRVVRAADSLRQQDVAAKRDDFEKRLRDLIDQLSQNQRKLYGLHQEIDRRHVDANEQAEALQRLTDAHEALTKDLNALARDAATAGIAPLGDKAKAVADEELRQAGEALRDALAQTSQARVAPLRRAEVATVQARDKLEALLQENRDLAKARLDELRLQELAERERELAEKVAQATTQQERDKLIEQQKKLAEELQKLGQNNEALREALRAAQAEQARRLAEKAAELAQTERALDEKLRESERQRNAETLAGLADKQQQLAAGAARLAEQTKRSAEAKRIPPLKAEAAAKAADSLRRGEADDALKHQERTARDLEQLADDLQHSLDLSRDPHEAARQLTRLQDETRQRPRATPEDREARRREEEAIRRAIERLPLPNDGTTAQKERRAAANQAAQAGEKLQQNDAKAAGERMGEVRDALNRLTQALPSPERRLGQARTEVAQLQKQQDEIGQKSERAARMAERNDPAARQQAADDRSEAARKQADQVERLAKFDAPGQEERRDRASQAAARALNDLLNNRNGDVPASQNEARRALERLGQALSGQTPDDAKARELADQQSKLADEAARAAGDPARQPDLQRRQERLARDAQGVGATEALVRQADAVRAAVQANKALREQPNDPATAEKLKDAAGKLQRWADQLDGKEANAERAERLAREQEAAAKNPPANAAESQRRTNQVADETKQVRANDRAASEKQKAVEAMAQLQRTPADATSRLEAQQAAAQALRQFADKLADPKAADGQTPTGQADSPPPTAQELAKQQRELARQTEAARRQSGAGERLALERAAAEQQKLQEQAARLPVEQAPQSLQQARQAMDRASQALSRNDATRAVQQQQQAAEALDRAARQAERAPTAGDRQVGEQAADGQPKAEQVAQAREMAKQQRDLQKQVRDAVGQKSEPRAGDAAAQAQQQQQQVAQQSGELAKGLEHSAKQMPNELSRNAAQDAARSAQQAEKALEQAQNGGLSQNQSSRREAINALDRAAQKSEQAARAADPGTRRASPNGQPPASETGEALQEAQGQMNQAQGQLSRGENQQAEGSMQQAAQALDQAARQMGQRNQGEGERGSNQRAESATRPATGAEPGKGDPNSAPLPSDLQKSSDVQKSVGKNWGELPGELRTRILQDMKAQYGDDYARIIKLYFEQIADIKTPK